LAPTEHDELLMKIGREIPEQHAELRHAMDEAVDRVVEELERESRVALDKPEEIKRRIKTEDLAGPFWAEVVQPGLRAVVTASRPYLENLRAVGRALRRFLEDGDPEQATPILELHSTVNKIEAIVQRVIRFVGDAEGQCRWIEYRRRGGGRRPDVTFCIAPLTMADHLREHLLRRFRTVALTSATLAVERRFDYFLRQIGADDPARLTLLGAVAPPADPRPDTAPVAAGVASADVPEAQPRRPLCALLLDTPFDYDRQVYLGIPADLPEPTAPDFDAALAAFLEPALIASRGRAFVLFTAYSLLERTFERLAPRLEPLGYPCLRQGQSGRTLLTEAFRRDIGSILFATASFWEGVDVPGEALSCLALTRLPFRVPGEPLVEARVEDLRRRGLDPFHHLIVPQAVIRFRQGFGRLIRNRTDRGAVLICDRRVITRPYGRMFLHSLPTDNVHVAPAAEVLERLERFFN
jgi:ATP-dependent DNA helicase DinG